MNTINLSKQPFIPSLPLIAPEEMTASQFRRAYGVPVASLPHVREALAMEREASREMADGFHRDAWGEIQAEFYDDNDNEGEGEADPLTLDGGDLLREAKGFRSSLLTCELVDGLED